MEEVGNEIESGFYLLGCSVVEDKLQNEVPSVIRDLIDVNVKVWMLTGDKLETAENIAFSCKLIQPGFEKIYLRAQENERESQDLEKLYH